MAMYDDGTQQDTMVEQQMQDTMVEQYDDNYGGEYDGQFVHQGYDTNMVGQDPTGTGIFKN